MSTTDALLAEATRRGIRLSINGARLRIEAPTGTLTTELRVRLAAAKPDILAHLREGSEAAGSAHQSPPTDRPAANTIPAPSTPSLDAMLSMPLEEFGRRALALRIRLPDGSECWFASGSKEVAILRGEGIERGSIWTARELADVLGAGWDRTTIGRLIATKRTFNGTIGPQPDALGPPAPPAPEPERSSCPRCGSRQFWRSIHGATTCGTCHPPAHPSLVADWLDPTPDEADHA